MIPCFVFLMFFFGLLPKALSPRFRPRSTLSARSTLGAGEEGRLAAEERHLGFGDHEARPSGYTGKRRKAGEKAVAFFFGLVVNG